MHSILLCILFYILSYPMSRVLLLGGRLQSLSVADSLLREGHSVAVISDDGTSRKSKLFEKHFEGSVNDESVVYEAIANYSPDVIIPMGDGGALFLSEHKSHIEKAYNTKCAVPDFEVITRGADKSLLMEFCRENDLPHPKTHSLTDSNISECVEYVGFPALIKPNHSIGARGITRVNNLHELQEYYPQIQSEYGDCTLQQFIDNKDFYFNVMLYRTKDGVFPNYAVSKIVRIYPLDAGSSCCCFSVDMKDLVDVCKKALDLLNWNGFADFDVLYDKTRNQYKIIEINPRVPASLRVAAAAGVNFPHIIVCDAMGKEIPKYEYKEGKVLRFLGTDLLWFLKSNKRFSFKPSWFAFFGKDVCYQDIYLSDSSTWFSWLTEGIKKFIKRNNHEHPNF